MAHHKRHRSAAQRGFSHKTYKPHKRNGASLESRQKANVTRKMQVEE